MGGFFFVKPEWVVLGVLKKGKGFCGSFDANIRQQ
jgi:hypothetical protein